LDDLLQSVYKKILKSKTYISPSKGPAFEALGGSLLELTNPRARLSRTETKGTVFSCLGEFLWYLSRSDDVKFIKYYIPGYEKYSDNGKTIYGAYGPRLFNMRNEYNQIDNIIKILKNNDVSRKAVVQLFDAVDITQPHNDVPCTCTLQFMVRKSRLYMFTSMRSNDAFLGLPHDIFSFTLLQEVVARSLGVELGTYKHAVGSLHLYEKDIDKAKQYIKEGWQEKIQMPAMPKGDPWDSIEKVISIESDIRNGNNVNILDISLDEYWLDIIRLLKIYSLSKYDNNSELISKIESEMSSNVYNPYILKKQSKGLVVNEPEQLKLSDNN
jgi:thymidylate synthase